MIGKRSRINRRAFLRAAGTAGVGLPFLEGMPERSAFAQSESPVFGFFICTSCGVVQQSGNDPERFWPTEAGPLTTESMNAFAAERCTREAPELREIAAGQSAACWLAPLDPLLQ